MPLFRFKVGRMKKRKPKIADKKLRGEWAEMMFMARATELGIAVSKPWGESRSYDFVVGRPGRFVAVQVKSTTSALEQGWVCKLRGSKPYPPGSFDFLAAYIVFEDAWYIIPEEEVLGMDNITLHTGSNWANYEKYREAWHLLGTRGDDDKGIDLQACAEEVREGETFDWVEEDSGRSEMRPRGLEALNPLRWLTRR
jgi:hypothetical protein